MNHSEGKISPKDINLSPIGNSNPNRAEIKPETNAKVLVTQVDTSEPKSKTMIKKINAKLQGRNKATKEIEFEIGVNKTKVR